MKTNLTHARTCVYNCNYHLVFSTKYRQKVLTSEIEDSFRDILTATALDKNFIIHTCEVGELDHLHIFISAHPKIAPAYIVRMIKGITGRLLFMRHPNLKQRLRDGHLWNPSYYLETIGSISEEAILTYISKQTKG